MGMVSVISLLALDLDGTLFASGDSVSPANRRAIADALALGVRVVLVTGRGLVTPRTLALDLHLGTPVICAHGALTVDPQSGREVDHLPIAREHAVEILQAAQREKMALSIYRDGVFYRREGTPVFMPDMVAPYWQDVPDLLGPALDPASMLRALGPEAVAFVQAGFAHLPLHFRVERWADFIECAITHAQASKHRALERLSALLGIAREEVLALGDSPNDLPMLQWAGIGVAMGNASAEVRGGVAHVTATNDQDGVARAIERFVLAPARRRSA